MDVALRIAALVALSAFTILSIIAVFTLRSVSKLIKESRDVLNDTAIDLKQFRIKALEITDEVILVKSKVNSALDELVELEKTARVLISDMSEMKVQAVDLMQNANQSLDELKSALNSIEDNMSSVGKISKPFAALSELVYDKVAPPVIQAANIISALTKAMSVFTNVISGIKKTK